MASAEVTFSGKGEAGLYQKSTTAAVKAKLVAGAKAGQTAAVADLAANATAGDFDAGTLVVTASGSAATVADDLAADDTKNAAVVAAKAAIATAKLNGVYDTAKQIATLQYDLEKAELELAAIGSIAVAKGKSVDMVAYSGYDMNVAVSAESDNGIVFGMGFDMGAGFIADQNDDRAMDEQGATIATSALTATMNGYKLSIGANKVDDTYDDSQNGDIGLSGNVGGVSFNLVHDLDEDTKAVAATQNSYMFLAAAADKTMSRAEVVAYTAGTAAVAAVHETTSLSLGGAVGDIAWSLAATTGDDRGDSAAKGSVTYSGIENLSLTLAHDNVGKLEGISKVTAKYTMGSLTATLSMADDKNKNSNTNAGGKASNNLSLAYAANGLAATFATDESSQWWVNTQYDLGGGAQAFATIDHTEFAVVGLNFAF
jgi:hypothetical protein